MLANRNPDQWALLAHTALDFSGRLMQAGALPKRFAAELLADATNLEIPRNQTGALAINMAMGGPSLGYVGLLQAVHCHSSQVLSSQTEVDRLQRSVSLPRLSMSNGLVS